MILLYHLIFPDDTPADAWNAGSIIRLSDFMKQMLFLRKHYQILPMEDYIHDRQKNLSPQNRLMTITFDDGYRSVFDLVTPFLIKEAIPATIFANTSHFMNNELLWFVYFNALCSEKCYESIIIDGVEHSLTSKKTSLAAWRKLISQARASGNAIEYSRRYSQKYPLPPLIRRRYEGLTKEQIINTSQNELFEIGGHTSNHPFLDQLSEEEQENTILENKQSLENLTGNPIRYIAYPGGYYCQNSIEIVKKIGFTAAFAVNPSRISTDINFELPRTDIYSPSLIKFILKINRIHKIKNILRTYHRQS